MQIDNNLIKLAEDKQVQIPISEMKHAEWHCTPIMQLYYTLLKGCVVIIESRIGNGWINNFFL